MLIRVQPDTQHIEGWMLIGFEVDADAAALLRSSLAPDGLRRRAAMHVGEVAEMAINEVEANPRLAEWEVSRKKLPQNLRPSLSQETTEEMELRRVNRTGMKDVTDVQQRNKENWTVQVWARRKQRLFPKYPTQLGPSEGFEAYDDLPDDYKDRFKPVYEEKGA